MSPSRSPTRGAGVSPERLPPPVQQAHRRGTGRDGGPRPRARHLEGARRGARRPHPGREPRRRPRHGGHVHHSGGGGGRCRGGRPPCRRAGGSRTRRAAAHPRGRRRPADAALRPRRALRGRLRSAGHGHAAGPAADHPDREAAPRAARSDPARRRGHRADCAIPPVRVNPQSKCSLRFPARRGRSRRGSRGRTPRRRTRPAAWHGGSVHHAARVRRIRRSEFKGRSPAMGHHQRRGPRGREALRSPPPW